MGRFGELEEAIMVRVWAAEGPVRVREVVEGLRRNREIAYATAQTVMEALRRKGWLDREKDGRAQRYWATASQADYTAQLMDQALADSPDRAAALVRFVERLDTADMGDRLALDRANAVKPS